MIFLRQMIKEKKETYNHIIKHIEAFIKIKDDKKEFILVSFVDHQENKIIIIHM